MTDNERSLLLSIADTLIKATYASMPKECDTLSHHRANVINEQLEDTEQANEPFDPTMQN